jgi:hypothetical protein
MRVLCAQRQAIVPKRLASVLSLARLLLALTLI